MTGSGLTGSGSTLRVDFPEPWQTPSSLEADPADLKNLLILPLSHVLHGARLILMNVVKPQVRMAARVAKTGSACIRSGYWLINCLIGRSPRFVAA